MGIFHTRARGTLLSSSSFTAATLTAALLASGAAAAASTCESLVGQKLPHATITAAKAVPAGTLILPGTTTPIADMPAFCRITGISKPTSDSQIGFEVWVPDGAAWNGKFAQVGNGAFAGTVPLSGIAQQVRRGYAAAGTDNGHITTESTDASWALDHPEKVIDFGYRSLKETTDKARALIKAYAGRDPRRSYFIGCSEGGREALMEAQRYPDDWDGIIAGAPGNFWTRMFTGFVWNQQALLDSEAGYVPTDKVPVLTKAALAQCAGKDGGLESDAFLNDPRDCRFDPAVTQCKAGQNPETCLAPEQVAAAKAIYQGPRNPRTGAQLFPGYFPGNEFGAIPYWVDGGTPANARHHALGSNYFQYFIYGVGSGFDVRQVNFDSDVARADAKNAPILNSTNPDLSRFKMRGGKLIQYTGWDDRAVSAINSLNYYNSVAMEMSRSAKPDAPFAAVHDFYRLFFAPGVGHCSGGPGANSFGNNGLGLSAADKSLRDADHDIVAALDRWVEQGIAPNRIVATKFNDDKAENGIAFQRPLCTYPQVSRYSGSGDPKLASSFQCVDDPDSLGEDRARAAQYVEQNKGILYNPPARAH